MIVAMTLLFQISLVREHLLNTLYEGKIIETQWSDLILYRPLGERQWYYRVIPSVRSESAPHLYSCSDAAVITGLNHPARNYHGVVIRQQTGISRFSGFQALSCDKTFPDFSCSFMKPLIKSVTQQENLGMGFHEFVSFQQANQANGVSRPPPAYLA